MDAIVKMVAERVGISEDQASQAVELIVGQLKDRLPGPIGDQLEGMLSGEGGGDDGGDVGDALKGLGGRLGL
jgi:uncharacterized protein (DUF2267 family)